MFKKIISCSFLVVVFITTNAQSIVVLDSVKGKQNPIYVIDGKIETTNSAMSEINPNDIKEINVLKGNSAIAAYGEQGKNGVIIITTKPKKVTIDTTIKMTVMVNGDKITINGEPVTKDDPRLQRDGKKIMIKRGKLTGTGNKVFKEEKDEQLDEIEMMEGLSPNATRISGTNNEAFLGVMTTASEQTIAGIKYEGAKVEEVNEESPATKAGFKKGDIITAVNDTKIVDPETLYNAIGKFKPEEKVSISIIRETKKMELTATLGKNKNKPMVIMDVPRGNKMQGFNFNMPPLSELNGIFEGLNIDKKPKLGISIEDMEASEGVKISSVTEGSIAEKAGLKLNDIITSVNDKKVKDVDGLKPLFKNTTEGDTYKFNINRNGKTSVIEVKFPKKIKSADL